VGRVTRTSSCKCGCVEIETLGAPVWASKCYCDDCQAGARQIEALPGAPRFCDDDGGTPFLVFRDDRYRFTRGLELLRSYTIRESTPTRRMVASCCNSGMFVKFARAHWTSFYEARFAGDLPALEIRIQTKHRLGGPDLTNDVPTFEGFPFRLFARLALARVLMIFGDRKSRDTHAFRDTAAAVAGDQASGRL
jgi:hypothetical protein